MQSQSYRSFEVYIAITCVYLALALLLRGMLALIGLWLFGRRTGRRVLRPAATVPA